MHLNLHNTSEKETQNPVNQLTFKIWVDANKPDLVNFEKLGGGLMQPT